MYNVLDNHKISNMRTVAQQTPGAASQTTIDLQEAVTAHLGLRERTSKGLIIIAVTAVAAGATLDIIVRDSLDNSTFDADFATLDQIDATGLYVAVVDGIQRYAYLRSTVATDNITWGAVFVGFDAERRPVQQSDTTELDVTYGTGR
jgi:hypothetical protein